MPVSVDEKEIGRSLFDFASTGDIILMNRKCLAMKSAICAGLCLLSKMESRFDHVGMIVKLTETQMKTYPETQRRIVDRSPTNTYVLENNINSVTLFSAEKRVLQSSSDEIVIRPLVMGKELANQAERELLEKLETFYTVPYKRNLAEILPSIFSPPDKMDRIHAARKITQIGLEIDAFEELLKQINIKMKRDRYRLIISAYKRSQIFLLNTYFPHLKRAHAEEPTSVNWVWGHFGVDGRNNSSEMVCSELIANLWTQAGITTGFVPASSVRPFDFLNDDRFNFTDRRTKLDKLVSIKGKDNLNGGIVESEIIARSRNKKESSLLFSEKQRVDFFNQIRWSCGMEGISDLDEIPTYQEFVFPRRWLVEFSGGDTRQYLGVRLFSCGILFSFWIVPCAPLTLRWMEHQLGLFLIRGSVWSLASWFLAHGVCYAIVQGLVASVLIRLLQTSDASSFDGMGMRSLSKTVDTRHPYYSVSAAFMISSLVSHLAVYPILNTAISNHFGPIRPGPLPLRYLLRGSLVLAPFQMLLPLQMYWLGWYETLGAAIVPTDSSVWRPHLDLVHSPNWNLHYRCIALTSAFTTTTVLDLLLYFVQYKVRRSLIKSLYIPQSSPSIGRNPFAGYSFRFVSNLFVFGATSGTLHFVFGLI